ncbi:MAG: hypothetical protein AAFN11_16220, partial [Chloroflexota bacterium]
ALAGLGNNVRIVQFAGGENGNSHTGNTLMDMLMNIPELSEVFMAKTEALSGEDFEQTLMKASQLFNTLRTMQSDAPQLVDYSNEADDEEPPLPPEIEEISGENGVASS